jgi:hypothetical protein
MSMTRATRAGRALALAVAMSAMFAGDGASDQIQDRRSLLAPTERTTDDPRRTPRRPATGDRTRIVLRGGRIFDSIGAVREGSLLIEGNTITALLPSGVETWPADAQVIDVTGKTVMPGLIDMHVHLTYPDPDTPIDEHASEGSGVLRGARNARYYVESGFTSIRDMNGVRNAPYLLSDWSAANAIPAPRVFTAGHIITVPSSPGKSMDLTPGVRRSVRPSRKARATSRSRATFQPTKWPPRWTRRTCSG